MTMLADQGHVTIDGVSLEYRMIGPPPGAAPTIVMLHEGLGSVSTWGAFPTALAARTGMGVFVYSRSGYGRSSPVPLPRPLDYMQRDAIAVVPQLLDAIGFQRGVLLGHSDGASIAAYYAGSVQDHRIRGLVLMAPHFFTEPEGLAEISRAREDYATSDLRARLARHHDHVDIAFRGWNDAWLDPGFEKSFQLTGVLAHIRVPILIVQGKDDRYGTIRQVRAAEELCGGPVEVMLLDRCGHAPHREQPAATLEAVGAFLDRIFRTTEEAAVESAS
jgi:pimeloyl-ACP methyl ester carboxylesterase